MIPNFFLPTNHFQDAMPWSYPENLEAITPPVPEFWHFAHSDRNGPVGLVKVVNGSVGTVTSRQLALWWSSYYHVE